MSEEFNEERSSGREGGARRRPFFKQRKSCPFQGENFKEIDYKNLKLLTRHISERGKIIPRRITSVSQKAQRRMSREIKRARFLALLPYIRA